MKLHYACKEINNFGDIVPVYIYEKMGVNVEWASADECEWIAGGSILHYANKNTKVQCAGFGQKHGYCEKPKYIKSVRGRLTRQSLIELGYDCPEIYEDMVDYLPNFYFPDIKKDVKVGYLPHYVDYEYFKQFGFTIDITAGVESVVDNILRCELIYTSSLHGIIACQTYGIKWRWVHHNRLASQTFKFYDYFTRINHYERPIYL